MDNIYVFFLGSGAQGAGWLQSAGGGSGRLMGGGNGVMTSG